MQTVVLDGVQYTKASALAEQFKYTSDYIGQLCRAKKVDARLVGRTWFVDADSLTKHIDNKHQKAENKTDTSAVNKEVESTDVTSNIKLNRLKVNAPLKNKTVKATNTKVNSSIDDFVRSPATNHSVKISYGQDDQTLIPRLEHKPQMVARDFDPYKNTTKKYLHIEPAMAKKLKISKSKTKHASFSATQLPDVALSGKLDISTYAAAEPPVATDTEVPAESAPTQASRPEKTTSKPTVPKKQPKTIVAGEKDIDLKKPVLKQRQALNAAPSFIVRIAPLLVTLFAAGVSFLLLTLVAEVHVSDVLSTSSLSFQIEKFLELFAR